MDHLKEAKLLFDDEINAIERVKNNLDETFNEVIEMLKNRKGKVIVCGIGKSGIIGEKITATLSSTGTMACFLHASEAMHGDLGIIQEKDIVILISYSGNSPEIVNIITPVKRLGGIIIGITGNRNSILAKEAEYVLDVSIPKEGNAIEVAPMSSTTATLVMGDAIANALINAMSFAVEDFAKYHPGGSLGRKLLSHISDFMESKIPKVQMDDDFNNLVYTISDGRLGMVLVYDGEQAVGIITDGDIRRQIAKTDVLKRLLARDCMHKGFISMYEDEMAIDALNIMHKNKISTIVVKNRNEELVGILPIYNIII